tara:strand:+ start:1529 stop:2455 length:927 start_codon:yes stop_codon:yes gene_type:complete
MEINRVNLNDKKLLISFFRQRSKEIESELINKFGRNSYKKITQKLQPKLKESRDNFIRVVLQKSEKEKWSKKERLGYILMLHYVTNVVMLESRHLIWEYEYMTFSRRNGELWEDFISVCFHYPVCNDLEIVVPPLFSNVKDRLRNEVIDFINKLTIDIEQKNELINYYTRVWLLVDAGEIQLELDMHCFKKGVNYNIDFKSGFSSNEKGNTNRLLVVASIYKNILNSEYTNLMMVRSDESENNHYLQTLKKSNLWEVSCSNETYNKIGEIVEFDLRNWININIHWENDLKEEVVKDFSKLDLMGYLSW